MSANRPASSVNATDLARIVADRRVCVLTGAGISTDSGIPDYRGPNGSLTRRSPIKYQDFLRSADHRRRYWARSCLGWPFMRERQPNVSHHIVANLQARGVFGPLITQNVDGLHHAAGSDPIIELHGSLDTTVCMDCDNRVARAEIQDEMLRRNPGWLDQAIAVAPDGDAELDERFIERFHVPTCRRCSGPIKPDVVLFGESVPRDRVARAFGWVDQAEVLLVLGSSLTVYSGYRFAEHASRTGKTVALVNIGSNRADRIASVKVDAPLADVLIDLSTTLGLDPDETRETASTPIPE